MSKFDELKKAAEAAIEREDCDRFVRRDDAQAVLELLAIQAQLVEALQLAKEYVAPFIGVDLTSKSESVLCEIEAAISAAGAQP